MLTINGIDFNSINFSNDFSNNFDVIKALVKYDGRILRVASDELQNNYDIVMTAIERNNNAVEYMGKNLQFNNIDEANYIIKLLLKHVEHK